MKRNAIILTSGLTGSSVLTGLIARDGFWTGETHKKEDYDTFENRRLIELNLALFRESRYNGNYQVEFSPEVLDRVASLHKRINDRPYREFVEQCNQQSPWIWKDPRLCLTIRFWKHLLPLDNCAFIVLTRAYRQCWISATLRRQIRSYSHLRRYEQRIKESALDFLRQNRLQGLQVSYEDLIVHPGEVIQKLNEHLQAKLTVGHLKEVYHKPLYRIPRSSWMDSCKAVMIYMKNYSQRVDAAPSAK